MRYFYPMLAIVLQFLGLTGLVDAVVEWKGFLGDIVNVYAEARDYLFAFLPFSVADWLKNYLITGVGVISAFNRSHPGWIGKAGEDMSRRAAYIFATIALFVLWWIWPLIFLGALIAYLTDRTLSKTNQKKSLPFDGMVQENPKLFVKEVIIVMMFFVAALFLFSDLLETNVM